MRNKILKTNINIFNSALIVLIIGGILSLVYLIAQKSSPKIHNSVGVNQQINYQGRLLTNTGAVVPDGAYNIEFKISQDGDGVLGGGDETLKWTETRTGGNQVQVKNGYFSVYLGAITAFASSVDWNQDTLWLSINIGGIGAPSWDGEMTPFTRFSSTPYSLNSRALGGLTADNFVKLAQGSQTDASTTNSSIFINKTGATSDILQFQKNAVDVFTVGNSGATLFRNSADSTTAFQVQKSNSEQLINVDTSTTSNLITNSNFESNTTGWALKGSSTISQTTSQKFLGNGSMSIANTAIDDGAKYNYALASQTTYTLTFYAKSSSNTVAVSTINTGRTEDGATDSNCATGQTINAAGWTKISCVFTTGNVTGTNHVYIKQTDGTARTIYIDSVELQTSSNLISNPDFETDRSGWTEYGPPTLSQTGTQYYTGTGSMQAVTSSTSGSQEGATADVSINPSTTYHVSFWAQLDSGAAGAKTFWVYKRFDSTDSGSGVAYASVSLSPGVWTKITTDITTSSVIHASPFIGILTNDSGDFVTQDTFYVDNVSVSAIQYNTNDIGRIMLNGIIDSPVVIQGQTSTNALQVQSASGSMALKVDTLNGRVGIGTNSPTASLHVQGKTYIQDTSSNTDTLFIEGSTGLDALKVGANTRVVTIGDSTYTNSNGQLNVYGTGTIKNQVNSTTGFRIQNASSVNIFGVDTSNSRLFSGIADGASSTGFTLNTTNAYSTAGAKLLSLQNATTEKFSIDKDGNLTLASGAVFKIGATSGLSTSCSSGQFLREQVALGGLTTSGTCATVTGTEITDGSVANIDLANSSINLALGTSGSDINWGASSVSLGGTATLNLPDATATARGLVTASTQTFGGDKVFQGSVDIRGSAIDLGNNAADLVTIQANMKASNFALGVTGTTTGTGTNTTTLTLTSDAFNVGDVVMIDNAGQDYFTRITVDPGTGSYTVSPAVTFETGRTVEKYNIQNIGATQSDYSTLSSRFFQGYFLGGIVTGTGTTSLSDGLLYSSGSLNINASSVDFNSNLDLANNLLLNIGNSGTDFTSGGGLTLADNLIANGDITLGDAATDGLTFTGEIRGASPFSFEGLTNDDIRTTFAITDPTSSSKIVTFPDATGYVILDTQFSSDIIVTSAGVVTIQANAIGASEVTDGTLTTSDLSGSAGITNAQLANSSITVTAGSGLTTGGSVSLGGSVTLDVGAGNGITVNANDIAVDLTTATDALSSTTSSGSGLEVLSTGVTLLQGCANGQTLKWDETNDLWQCGSDRATFQNRLSGNYTNTTTTFSDVDDNATGTSDMGFAVGTSETWIFEAVLYVNSPTLADHKLQVTAPAGATCVVGFENSEDTVSVGNTACATSSGTLNSPAAAYDVIRVSGTIVTVGTSGTVMVQYGQAAASGTSTIAAGSNITAYKVSGADLAEIYYSHNGSIEPGTVVIADQNITAGVKPSDKAYSKSLVGVVSTQPGMVIGGSEAAGTPVPLALSGRVPVKVSTENGVIKPGDQLTSSSTPGVAMKATKAGAIIGQAMTAYDGQGVGQVTVFIKTSYGTGGNATDLAGGADASDPDFGKAVLSRLMNDSGSLVPQQDLSEIVTDRVVAGLEIITPKITTDEVSLNSIKPTDAKSIDINGDVVVHGTLTADKIKANQIEGLEIFTNRISAVPTSSLTPQPEAQTTDTGTNNNTQVPAESPVEFGKITIDSATVTLNLGVNGTITTAGLTVNGPAEFRGNTTFYKLVTFVEKTVFNNDIDFVGRATFNNDTAGFAVIQPGQTQVHVDFTRPYDQLPVVTLSVKNGQFIQYAYRDLTAQGFTIVIEQPTTTPVEFSWNALSVKNARTSSNP